MNTLPRDAVVGVVGAGAMGSGIAQVALLHGHRVLLTDVAPAALERGCDAIRKALAREVEKGRLTGARMDEALSRLDAIAAGDMVDMAPCQFVIEAVVERLDVKLEVMRALEEAVAPDALLATNTSSLSIASIGAACARPERVVGVHFFNPAAVMPLVEIVPGVRTSPAVVDWAASLVQGWGKLAVRAKDTPGFIVNRIARPYYGEALRIAEEGMATPATIDWAMKTLAGFRMGPFELMDFIGHDVNYAVTESVWTAMYFDPRYRPSILQKRLLEAGLLGRKSGAGFFDYSAGAPHDGPNEDQTLGSRIFMRILTMLINEAVDAVHLQIATPAAIDLAMTKGVNYPKGLLAWGDELGWPEVLARMDELRTLYSEERYRASPLMRRCRSRASGSSNERL
ncbi:MAG: 3-hydroxyacyl-CoA dehydrogenase NAD-binding domain-containing protein [Gemmatimonadaceae bacterium]